MQSVDQARAAILEQANKTGLEICPLSPNLIGRILGQDIVAERTQPPSALSAMDGYAVRKADLTSNTPLEIIGQSAAGHPFSGRNLTQGQAIRIFTGAAIPEGADHVIIQEQVTQTGTKLTLIPPLDSASYIRPAGLDFTKGDTLLQAPKRLTARDIALIAATGRAFIPLQRKPHVTIIANGDELAWPSCTADPQAILTSNNFGIAALVEELGGTAELTPIAKDTPQSVEEILNSAYHADIIVTIGGASVGDHDLIHTILQKAGAQLSVQKIAMRPGKPLMAGRLGRSLVLGLPGNPVSAMICAHIFLIPTIKAMLGLPKKTHIQQAQLLAPLPENGIRTHYMRAVLSDMGVRAFKDQDSSRLRLLAQANALIIRPPHVAAAQAGDIASIITLR